MGGATLLQRALVITQAALSLVLLVGAGLFGESLGKLQSIDLKLDAKNRYIVHFNPQAAGYSTAQVGNLYHLIEERFHAVPGIEEVGISTYTPMEDNNSSWSIQIQGKPDPHINASYVKATAEYFDSVGTRVVMGRGISVNDTPASPSVAVVNESFVKKFFNPGENPIGHHFGGGPKHPADFEIVGVVEDTAYQSAQWRNHRMYFVPMLQRPQGDTGPIEGDTDLYAGAIVLKTTRLMPNMEGIARKTLAGINPNLSVVKFQTFEDQIADRFTNERMMSRLTMYFGGLALLLATLGMYGVTAYAVARRSTEIGIRMALGAKRLRVTMMVMRGALIQAGLGLGIGIPTALLCVHFVTAQLYEIQRIDAMALLSSVLAIVLAALFAGLIPARRAASIDPAMALLSE
jgi:predicted permease